MNGEEQNYWQGDHDQPDMSSSSYVRPSPVEQKEAVAPVSWEASEYIHHEKDLMWFVGFVAISAALIAVSIFLLQSWTFTTLIVVMAIAVVVFARRPPRTLHYTVSAQGVQINEKTYSLHDFKEFGVVQDGSLYSIVLIPIKRFMPSVNVYFPQEYGEQIVNALGSFVPMEHIQLDMVDKLVRKLRFYEPIQDLPSRMKLPSFEAKYVQGEEAY